MIAASRKTKLHRPSSLQLIWKLVLSGEIQKALAECLSTLDGDCDNYKLLILTGDLYLKLGRGEQAIEYFLEAAACCNADGDYRKAIAILKRVRNLDPKLTKIHFCLVDLYRRLQLNNEAKYEMRSLIEQNQKSQQLDVDTIRAYLKLAELEPESLDLRKQILGILRIGGMMQELRDQCLEMSVYADFYISKGRLNEAYEWIQVLIFEQPENPEYSERLELILETQSNHLQDKLSLKAS